MTVDRYRLSGLLADPFGLADPLGLGDVAADGGVAVGQSAVLNAPYFTDQWYLQNTGQTGGVAGRDIDVVPAWGLATGQGVTVVVNDTGVDYTNPDIAPNYDAATSYSLDAPTNNAYPFNDIGLTGSAAADLAHGTWVSGLIAGANNGSGIVGVAYGATLSAYRVIDTLANQQNPWGSIAAALTNSAKFDVANNSWGFTSALADSVFNSSAQTAINALLGAAQTGRGGLGTINVFAAGNYYGSGDDTNLHAFQSSINVVTVAALDASGTVNAPGGRYSTPGASILVSAPGTDITSDAIVGQGDIAGGYLQSGLEGTSFATPLVSGTIALMLQANPGLGLRDVQEILAYTAVQTDPGDITWHSNGAANWNGGGLHVSDDYGFGLVDAAAAVRLAKSWTLQETANNRTIDTVAVTATGAIAASTTRFTFNVPQADAVSLQWVRVQVSFRFAAFDNLLLTLTSPGGASSVLLDQPNDGIGGSFNNTLQLSSDQFWGQMAPGTWTLSFANANPGFGDTGALSAATLVLVGDPAPVGTTYVYTNEYAGQAAASPGREVLNDPSGKADEINLAAVTADCSIDLVAGTPGAIGSTPFSIAAGTLVDNVYTGAGAATVYVNAVADTITSGGGADTVVFPASATSYTLARQGSVVTAMRGGVTDTLTGVTRLQFSDQSIAAASIACFAAGTRILTTGGERAVEALVAGDVVPTLCGRGLAEVVWLGHRRVECARHPRPEAVWPIRVAAGAFGPGRPHRDLWLSPDHAVFADGVLIPVRLLVNGGSIRQEAAAAVTWWHVELTRHDVLLAEGLACESFLDTGNRAAFSNGGSVVMAQADFALGVWEAQSCAPLALGGVVVERVRARIKVFAELFSKKRPLTSLSLA